MDDRIFKNLPLRNFDNFKIHEIFVLNPRIFFGFLIVLQCTQREHVHNGNGRWARIA